MARGLDVHPSNTTRTCDRLVAAGLLHRSEDPADRRSLVLELTPAGQGLVDSVNARRRDTIAELLTGMSLVARSGLVQTLRSFATDGGESRDDAGAWALG